MELSSLPKSPLLSRYQYRFLAKPVCSLGVPFSKIAFQHSSLSLSSTRTLLLANPLSSKLAALSVSVTALSSVGGGGDALAGGGGGGGGGGGSGGGGGEGKSIAYEEALSQGSDVIVLYVGVIQLSFSYNLISFVNVEC
jgi:hypothetical protein